MVPSIFPSTSYQWIKRKKQKRVNWISPDANDFSWQMFFFLFLFFSVLHWFWLNWLDFVLPEDDWDLESSSSGSSDYGGEGGDRIFDEDAAFSAEYAAAMDKQLLSTDVLHTSVDAARKVSSFSFIISYPSLPGQLIENDVIGRYRNRSWARRLTLSATWKISIRSRSTHPLWNLCWCPISCSTVIPVQLRHCWTIWSILIVFQPLKRTIPTEEEEEEENTKPQM